MSLIKEKGELHFKDMLAPNGKYLVAVLASEEGTKTCVNHRKGKSCLKYTLAQWVVSRHCSSIRRRHKNVCSVRVRM